MIRSVLQIQLRVNFVLHKVPLINLVGHSWSSDLCPRLEYLLDADDKDGGDGEDGPEYLDSVGDVTKDDDLKQQGDYDAASILHQADNMGLLYLNGFDGQTL